MNCSMLVLIEMKATLFNLIDLFQFDEERMRFGSPQPNRTPIKYADLPDDVFDTFMPKHYRTLINDADYSDDSDDGGAERQVEIGRAFASIWKNKRTNFGRFVKKVEIKDNQKAFSDENKLVLIWLYFTLFLINVIIMV